MPLGLALGQVGCEDGQAVGDVGALDGLLDGSPDGRADGSLEGEVGS